MVDVIFAAVFFIGFICLKFFVEWCDKQIENKKD
ncbi:hypothetical protein CLMAG_17630 [Clostridium magnum DSM 2767]|uniref:Uncharacterized protein n=1 Tax=Clostridium magnum DSM 2767 TaxID=1121326 RepID=A0A162SWJ2_9CLOT|nr:hypothetical protein CLMAG_17630 [Clostridium magnum DSM 2767]